MKRKALLISVLIASISIFTISVKADAVVPIVYWYSNGSDIGHWTSTPTISAIKLNINSNFSFTEGFNHARSQWSGAGVATTNGGVNSSANIVCRGGTATQLASALGKSADTFNGVNGITFYYYTFQSNLDYNGTRKYLYTMGPSEVCIVDKGNSANQVKNTFTHEVGHALGWLGHSSVSSDVMYTYGTSVTTLTNRDKRHLVQIY